MITINISVRVWTPREFEPLSAAHQILTVDIMESLGTELLLRSVFGERYGPLSGVSFGGIPGGPLYSDSHALPEHTAPIEPASAQGVVKGVTIAALMGRKG